ncbi:MAG: putative ornithine cyclodeaminase [Chthonomonadales bacterium]|nr:putative ornithine cyclodeaminase [Chthonomonadales bacterium]
MRILDAEAVRAALPMAEAIAAVRWAYVAFATGKVTMPPRIHLPLVSEGSVSLVMPAVVAASPEGRYPACYAVKTVSVCPANAAQGLPVIQGGVLVLDPETGGCLALLDGAALTALRTGAGSGVATELLARPDATTLAVLGAGGQAAAQMEAVCAVRPIETVWLFDRARGKAEELGARWAGRNGIPLDIRVAGTVQEAVRDADVVCTVTTSRSALFEDVDMKVGAHINAIGAFRPDMQEIPFATVGRARLFVDSREAVLHEAGDILLPMQAGLFGADHIVGEIGAALGGLLVGREREDQITLFKSVGMAAQDAVTAAVALRRAEIAQIGACF